MLLNDAHRTRPRWPAYLLTSTSRYTAATLARVHVARPQTCKRLKRDIESFGRPTTGDCPACPRAGWLTAYRLPIVHRHAVGNASAPLGRDAAAAHVIANTRGNGDQPIGP